LPPRVNRKPAYPVGRERGNAAVRYAATRSLISLNKMKNKPRQFRAGADLTRSNKHASEKAR
jgi:hypothetical protein